MALNKVDTLQRAYNKMDTCSPVGNWIEEPSYNKFASTGNQRRVLVGNWHEELGVPEVATTTTFSSTQRASYNEHNADVTSQARAPLGLRSQRRAAEITRQAIATTLESQAATLSRTTATMEDTYGSSYGDVFGRHVPVRREVPLSAANLTYATDRAITVFSGNPVTGTKMVVQGGTEASANGNPFARNCDFTTNVETSLAPTPFLGRIRTSGGPC